jgi:hypothetical protein
MENEWVNAREAREILGIEHHALLNRVKKGALPSMKWVQCPRRRTCKIAMFLRSDVEHSRDTYHSTRPLKPRPEPILLDVSDTDAAYMAGLIDGEGTIGIIRYKGKSYGTLLAITNTHQGVLEWCHEKFGGTRNRVTRKTIRPQDGWSTPYMWQANSHRVKAVLVHCLPYLKIKKDQAILAIEFVDRMAQSPYHGASNPIPPEELEIRADYKRRLSLLNNPNGVPRAYRKARLIE